MRSVISGMAYFFGTALVILIVLMIIATLNMQRLGFGETESVDGEQTRSQTLEGEGITETLSPNQTHITENTDIDVNTENEDGDNSVNEVNIPVNPNAAYYDGELELPVTGATGYASVDIDIFLENSAVDTLKAGTAFVILEELQGEDAGWWMVSVQGRVGLVRHIYCMINLPDVIPSIVYNNANAYSSVFLAAGKEIPNITGKTLYSYSDFDRRDGKAENKRLREYEYIVPVLYSMSKRVCAAQRSALANGDTLVIYEGFRPYDTQQSVAQEVQRLAGADAEVRRALNTSPWSSGWFIATGTSNHQEGYAIDVTLGRIIKETEKVSGDYKYKRTESYFPYAMPTEIHDLGMAAAIYTSPNSRTMTASMSANEYAQALQKYCMDAGLSPLASEWWHFNDEYTRNSLTRRSSGRYEIKECLSKSPRNYD